MLDPAHPFTKEDFAFIRSRGTRYGGSDTWRTEADAAAGFANGWLIVANGLRLKGATEEEARKSAQVFMDAAWAEWHRRRATSSSGS